MEKLKEIACDPQCGFVVRSHDEKEVINIAHQHAFRKHNMNAKEAELRKMMKTV